MEAELTDLLISWRRMISAIPTLEDYKAALAPRPFENSIPKPREPNHQEAMKHVKEQIQVRLSATERTPVLIRLLPGLTSVLVAVLLWVGGFGSATLAWPIMFSAAVGLVAGIAVRLVQRSKHKARLAALAIEAFEKEWPDKQKQLDDDHVAAVAAYEQESRMAAEQWEVADRERIDWARRLLDGEADAIDEAVTETLSDLDFPFDAECTVGVDESTSAFVDVDLPEIEDVIPETQHRVLKNGTLKSVKRNVGDRNEAYAGLVVGIAAVIATTAFCAAPTLQRVVVAAFTQRRNPKSQTVDDTYVYEVPFTRDTLRSPEYCSSFSVMTMASLHGCRVAPGGSNSLKAIAPPTWVDHSQR